MARDILHVGDVGIPIRVTVKDRETKQPRDLSDYVSGTLRFKKPSGTTVDKTATKVGDGTAGEIEYVTVANDINEAGTWYVQPVEVVTAGDGPWAGDADDFLVRENLAEP